MVPFNRLFFVSPSSKVDEINELIGSLKIDVVLLWISNRDFCSSLKVKSLKERKFRNCDDGDFETFQIILKKEKKKIFENVFKTPFSHIYLLFSYLFDARTNNRRHKSEAFMFKSREKFQQGNFHKN